MEYNTEKIRYISHEIKNQLSICDLYTVILDKYCQKNGIKDETLLKSIDCIKRAVELANNSLIELKSSDTQELREYRISDILNSAKSLSEVYAKGLNIKFIMDIKTDETVSIDKNRFLGVIINLVKNACESFEPDCENGIIKISAEKEDSIVRITVSNNAKPIEDIDVFQEGLTTKPEGSGLGLYISRKNMEEMGGTLKLIKSDKESTEFEIMVKAGACVLNG